MKVCGGGEIYIPPNSSVRGYYADMSFLEVDKRLAGLSITSCCRDYGIHRYRLLESPNTENILKENIPYGEYLPGNLVAALGYMSGRTKDVLERIMLKDIIVLGTRLKQGDISLVPRFTSVDRNATKVRLELVQADTSYLNNSLLFYTAP
jgi:hypothetical protein